MKALSKFRALALGLTLSATLAQADAHEDALDAVAPIISELADLTDVANASPFLVATIVIGELDTITRGLLYHNVTLFFATNRALTHDPSPDTPADQFKASIGPLRYGIADVSIPKDHAVGHLETQSWLESVVREPNPEKFVILQAMQRLEPDFVMAQLGSILERDGTSTLLYIHGFNVGVDTAARRAGQLTYDLDWTGPSFFFSWPSLDRAGPIAYNTDQDTARLSTGALESVLEEIAATDTDRIVIIAHSMGTDLLAQTLQLMERSESAALDKIETVILAAPDINEGIFRTSIVPAIRGIKEQNTKFNVTVYASADDSALGIARSLASGNKRIGAMSEINDEQRAAFEPVIMVDASLAETNLFGHTYINDNPSVIADVYCLLQMGADPKLRASLKGVPDVAEGPAFQIPASLPNRTLDNGTRAPQFTCEK